MEIRKIPEEERLSFLPNAFGNSFPFVVESSIYILADNMIPNYNGGLWDFAEAKYKDADQQDVCARFLYLVGADSIQNPFSGDVVESVSDILVGMIVTLYALNFTYEKITNERNQDKIAEAIYNLRDAIYLYAQANGYERQVFAMVE